MFAFPQIISVPILSSLGSGADLFPTAGSVLAWALLAALVGTALGILRDSTSKTAASGQVHTVDFANRGTAVHGDRTHREAA